MTPGFLPAHHLEGTGLVRAVFTTRQGGESREPYASFNLAQNVGDSPEAVTGNRRRLAEAIDAPLDRLVEAEQVHGNGVAVIGEANVGAVLPGVDALVTDSVAVWLAVYAADCAPVLVLDPVVPAVAAVHAGWRGVAKGVVPETLRRMRETFGTLPARCLVALGPAIGGCCYEVDTPVARAMEGMAWWPRAAQSTGPGRWRLDLREAVRSQLATLGVPSRAVAISALCTKCRPDLFFSYRRDRVTGRMAACIRLCGGP